MKKKSNIGNNLHSWHFDKLNKNIPRLLVQGTSYSIYWIDEIHNFFNASADYIFLATKQSINANISNKITIKKKNPPEKKREVSIVLN